MHAQRTYKSLSVLSTGNWYQFSLKAEGVYKLDLSFFRSLGISGTIPSAQIRIFGNGGGMLPEANTAARKDDLEENDIAVFDGGDGTLDGNDYVLFYTRGPHQWQEDSVTHRFHHIYNIYSDEANYFVTLSGTGRRIALAPAMLPTTVTTSTYDAHYFHELDTVNFLQSGKEWFGEEFSAAPGRSLSRNFTIPNVFSPGSQVLFVTDVAGRSVGTASRFTISANSQPVQQMDIPSIGTGLFDLFAQNIRQQTVFTPNGPLTSLTYTFSPGSFNGQGWLNWFEISGRAPLDLSSGNQLFFRDHNTVGNAAVTFNISGADAASTVWDVSDPLHPVQIAGNVSGNSYSFTNNASTLHEYAAFKGNFPVPKAIGRIANQNLHQTQEADLIVITDPSLVQQATRLADFHRQRDGLRTVVVTVPQIYNEFSSGNTDPTAIRDFVKMYYDRYRATWQQKGKYLLLAGKASFDYKNRISGNTNLVPAYESASSLDPLGSYTSDDYFGFLDDHEDINSGLIVNLLDIGIGRIPARSPEELKNFADKLNDYVAPAAFGPWRNNIDFVADDEDNNLHFDEAESLSATVATLKPEMNEEKIYLDAYRQEASSAGAKYPQVNAAISSNIYNGTLIWNYTGHGGPERLAEETILDQQVVDNIKNTNRLPVFITATCDFAAFDQPGTYALGENLLLRPHSGAISLLTTTRVVFAFSNKIINSNFLETALNKDSSGRYRTLGQALLLAKNQTYQTSGDINNNRKFTLLGDPALTPAFPKLKAVATKLNGKDIASAMDTLKATDLVDLEGQVENSGTFLPSFQGTAYLTLFDKPQNRKTLGNDPGSLVAAFTDQETFLFRGKATIQNGKFSFRFRMPKDINYQLGKGKISLYVQDGISDGNGFSDHVVIGGSSASSSQDHTGPEIKSYLNDEKFVNGGLVNASPVLILHLTDSSGINTGGTGIGHDLVATLDNDTKNFYVLNNYYETDLDSYQKGSVRFQLPELAPGLHSLHIKVWDVLNNSSETILDFTVVNNATLQISHVLNYPNPFTSHTSFWFEHNHPDEDLLVRIDIFTVTGKLIKTISKTINTTGNRSNDVEWNGKDEYEHAIGRGVYIYHLRVHTRDGKAADKWERLVLL